MTAARDLIKYNPGKPAVVLFATVSFAGFLIISLFKSGAYAMDETLFHYPNVLNYYTNGFAATFNKSYSAANTPLPYIIVAWISKVFGPGIVLARIVTAVFSFLTFLAGLKILTRLQVPPFYSLILLFYPYFFLNSFVFYAINFGLFFCLVALLLLQHPGKNYRFDLGAGISITLAVLCQQFYLMLLAAVLLVRLWQYFQERDNPGALQYFLISSFLLGLPALIPLAIFYRWGGLVHPNFNVHKLSFFATALTGMLIVIGFYFWPFVLQSVKKLPLWLVGAALAAGAVLSIVFKPAYNDFNGPGIFNGIVYHLINIVARKMVWAGSAIMILFSAIGLLLFYKLAVMKKTDFNRMLFTACLFLTAAYTMNAIIGERHLLPLLFLLFLLVLPQLRMNIAKLYLPCMVIFGAGYYIYWIFLKYN
ncbi:MAG: hypothetical protein ABIU63_06180 [Chitinophagaceae bacterium]